MPSSETHVLAFLTDPTGKRQTKASFRAWLKRIGLPPELAARLLAMWDTTCRMGGKVIRIGRIVMTHLKRFVVQHPHLAIGVALAAAVGTLVTLVPALAPWVQPLRGSLRWLMASLAGLDLDRSSGSWGGELGSAVLLAQEVFTALASLLSDVTDEWRWGL